MPVYTWLNNTLGIQRAFSSRSGHTVLEVSGLSLPDKDHIAARAPEQHGNTYIATWFRPREFSITISLSGCDAADFQQKHRALARVINPLDSSTLRIESEDHLRFYLDCKLVTGVAVNRQNSRIAEVLLQLIACNPFFYTDEEEYAILSSLSGGLFIAFTIPGIIGSPANQASFTITNDGHIYTTPVITIDGPIDNPAFYNDTSGQVLTVNELVLAGSQLVIDMGNRTAFIYTGAAATNVLGSLTGTFWNLAVGDNDIRIVSDNAAVFTGTIVWTERYLVAV